MISSSEIWFDTDIGSDVDDALALYFLAQMLSLSEEPGMVAVSTSYGPTEVRARAASALLNTLHQSSIPVYAGQDMPSSNVGKLWSTGNEHLGGNPQAQIISLAELSQPVNEDVTLLITGPSTNSIELLSKDAFRKHCKKIIMMGGSFQSSEAVPQIENNFEGDPAAMQFLLQQGVPITLLPIDLTLRFPLGKQAEDRLMDNSSDSHQLLQLWATHWKKFTEQFPINLPFRNQIYLHDPLAAAYCYWPELFETRSARISVLDTGEIVESETGNLVTVCTEVSQEVIHRLEEIIAP